MAENAVAIPPYLIDEWKIIAIIIAIERYPSALKKQQNNKTAKQLNAGKRKANCENTIINNNSVNSPNDKPCNNCGSD